MTKPSPEQASVVDLNLRKAVKPFIEWVKKIEAMYPDTDDCMVIAGFNVAHRVTMADLRALRKATEA